MENLSSAGIPALHFFFGISLQQAEITKSKILFLDNHRGFVPLGP